MLPPSYADAIESYLSSKSTKLLANSFKKLSTGYRRFESKDLGSVKEDVDAYLVGRLPLTFSVLCHLLKQIDPYLPDELSIIDYGCGPGTALLALSEVYRDKQICYLGIEEKKAMLDAAHFLQKTLQLKGDFLNSDVNSIPAGRYELAIASYLLNELKSKELFFEKLLARHEQILVIEPGTPDGTEGILKLREMALKAGFHVVMPCPHEQVCPFAKPGWCHFYTRVMRSKMLKTIKEGSLGYEDEKYMFLYLSKINASSHSGVIVAKPVLLPFQIERKVCTSEGNLQIQIIPKKDKEAFKKAKKKSWGDFI